MQQRRLYRSDTEKMLFGVCGGIAEYFNVDPTIVRVGFAVLALLNGVGLILYLILAIIVPRKPLAGTDAGAGPTPTEPGTTSPPASAPSTTPPASESTTTESPATPPPSESSEPGSQGEEGNSGRTAFLVLGGVALLLLAFGGIGWPFAFLGLTFSMVPFWDVFGRADFFPMVGGFWVATLWGLLIAGAIGVLLYARRRAHQR